MRAFILLFTLMLLSGEVLAHGLECNQPTIEFNEAISHNFRASDLAQTGGAWELSSECAVGLNRATGNGEAACTGSAPLNSVEVALESLEFYLGCKDSAHLSFTLAFQDPSEIAQLFIEILPSGASSWQLLNTYDQSVGTPSAGVALSIDLSAAAGAGFAPTAVRWRFVSGQGSDAYAQLDEISLDCTDAPTADIDLVLNVDPGPVPAGALRQIKVITSSFGPSLLDDLKFELGWIGETAPVPSAANPSSLTYDVDSLAIPFDSVGDGEIASTPLWFRFDSPSLGSQNNTVTFKGALLSSVCDVRLNNNQREVTVAVDPLSEVPARLDRTKALLQRSIKRLARAQSEVGCSLQSPIARALHRRLQRVTSKLVLNDLVLMNPESGAEAGKYLRRARRRSRELANGACGHDSILALQSLRRGLASWNRLGEIR